MTRFGCGAEDEDAAMEVRTVPENGRGGLSETVVNLERTLFLLRQGGGNGVEGTSERGGG